MAPGGSNVRIFWIVWCSFWALFWFAVGFATLGLGWIGVPASLFMILIPVGGGSRPAAGGYMPPALGPSSASPPGWYPDPWTSGQVRWWDGQGWH